MSQELEETPIRLLLVDDEEAVLRSLRRLFRSAEYQVHTATSGGQALEYMAGNPVDIIISDMRMPSMSGAQFLEQVAKKWPDTIRMVLTGYADLGDTIKAINSGHIYRYFSKPWDEGELRLSVSRAAEQQRLRRENRRLLELTARQNQELKSLNAGLEERVAARTAELKQTADMLDSAYAELKANYDRTVELLAHLTDKRNPASQGHGQRVAELAMMMALHLKLDSLTAQNIRNAGLLHDIGKVVLPDEVVSAPARALTEEQRKLRVKHAQLGEAALMGLPALKDSAILIRSHHEHFDGSGYPDRLKGDAIPLGARILAVAEAFDELCTGAQTGHVHSSVEALDYIRSRSGSYYDPAIVKVCGALQEELSELHEQASAGVLSISTQDAEPGMVLFKDLVSSDGMLLLTKGHELTDSIIEKIRRIEHEDGAGYSLQIRRQ